MPTNKDTYTGFDIVFADGKKRNIRPLTIRQLRKFMKIANNLKPEEDGTMSDEDIDRMVESASIALASTDLELSKDLESLEDLLDLKIYGAIMAAAMGNDPNA